ncbi:hypothetical protein HYR99_32990 [Candidatus Poribacteria bacterium]|nr:hypothetical protein [Candidatus Poribacteria bacterium]
MKNVKLGFIVESHTDEIIVETLARCLLPSTAHFYTVPLGDKGGFYSAYTTVFKFLGKAYDHVIVLFDTDSTDPVEIEERQRRYEAQFKKYGLDKDVTLCPAVPQIEAWLLANYVEHPEQHAHPGEKLAEALQVKKLTEDCIKQLAQTADIDVMKNRNPSFAAFVKTLQTVAS